MDGQTILLGATLAMRISRRLSLQGLSEELKTGFISLRARWGSRECHEIFHDGFFSKGGPSLKGEGSKRSILPPNPHGLGGGSEAQKYVGSFASLLEVLYRGWYDCFVRSLQPHPEAGSSASRHFLPRFRSCTASRGTIPLHSFPYTGGAGGSRTYPVDESNGREGNYEEKAAMDLCKEIKKNPGRAFTGRPTGVRVLTGAPFYFTESLPSGLLNGNSFSQ